MATGYQVDKSIASDSKAAEAVRAIAGAIRRGLQNGEPKPKTDQDYRFYWLAHVLGCDFRLEVEEAFERAIKPANVSLSRQDFETRLIGFLKDVDPTIWQPTPGLIDRFFEKAIQAHQQMAVFSATCTTLRGSEYKKMLIYLRNEIARFKEVKRLLRTNRAAPPWASAFMCVRTKALEELIDDTYSKLASTYSSLYKQSSMLGFGRTDIESHVLFMWKEPIRQRIEGTPLEGKLLPVVGAFAHASNIIPKSKSSDVGTFLNLIKMRISRAQSSKHALVMRSILNIGTVWTQKYSNT